MRILIANTPLMYRETLALAVHRHNPDFEVMIADPASMDGEASASGRTRSSATTTGSRRASPDGVMCWVGIIIDDHLKARISMDGKVSEIHEVRPGRNAGRPRRGREVRFRGTASASGTRHGGQETSPSLCPR